MQKKTIDVLIVEDSKVDQELLKHIIESDPSLKVVGCVENSREVLSLLKRITPDVITMDIFMPFANGFELTQRIMETKPVPIVIISSAYNLKNTDMAFHAVKAGALAILEKPGGLVDNDYFFRCNQIIQTIKTISEVKLIKKRSLPKMNHSTNISKSVKEDKLGSKIKAIAIAASIGGPPALAEILSHLPPSFPVPIFIVQHIAVGFTEGLVRWLQSCSPSCQISLAKDKEQALPGCVYVAPDNCQMEIRRDQTICINQAHSSSLQPSAGALFRSMAYAFGPQGVGVILTGMGKDGAQELLLMKQKGAYTIAQDEKSCAVFGMPKEAIIIGAIDKVLPLDCIADALVHLMNLGRVTNC